MKPAQLLLVLTCVAFVFVAYSAFQVMLFRVSCSLANLPRPSLPRSIGVLFAATFAVSLPDAAIGFAVTEAYQAGGYPLWEAGLVGAFLFLPVHMLTCAAIHSWLTPVTFTDGIAVWLIESAIRFGILVAAGGIVGTVFVLARG